MDSEHSSGTLMKKRAIFVLIHTMYLKETGNPKQVSVVIQLKFPIIDRSGLTQFI